MAWRGVTRRGMAWHGVACCGMVWHGVACERSCVQSCVHACICPMVGWVGPKWNGAALRVRPDRLCAALLRTGHLAVPDALAHHMRKIMCVGTHAHAHMHTRVRTHTHTHTHIRTRTCKGCALWVCVRQVCMSSLAAAYCHTRASTHTHTPLAQHRLCVGCCQSLMAVVDRRKEDVAWIAQTSHTVVNVPKASTVFHLRFKPDPPGPPSRALAILLLLISGLVPSSAQNKSHGSLLDLFLFTC